MNHARVIRLRNAASRILYLWEKGDLVLHYAADRAESDEAFKTLEVVLMETRGDEWEG